MALRGLGLLPVLVATNDLIASIVSVDASKRGDETSPVAERVLVLRNFGRSKWQRNDVVAFSSPTRPSSCVARLKHFDGEMAKFNYGGTAFGRLVAVPPGRCWLETDEARSPETHDSRAFGPIPMALLEGKVVAVVWPPSRARWVS